LIGWLVGEPFGWSVVKSVKFIRVLWLIFQTQFSHTSFCFCGNHPGGTGDSLSGQCRGSLQCLLGEITRTTLGVLPSGGRSNALSRSLRFLMKSLEILPVSVLFACCQLSRETARLPTGSNRCVSSLSFFHLSLSLCSFAPRCSLPCSRFHVCFSLNSSLTPHLVTRAQTLAHHLQQVRAWSCSPPALFPSFASPVHSLACLRFFLARVADSAHFAHYVTPHRTGAE
jgi:hypothetical protein